MGLNPEQAAAVEHPHNRGLCVVAGAGTGKTHLLSARFVRLVQECGVAPDRILCLTFTKKAAAHMRARILGALREAGHPVARPETLWITTFHAAAYAVLRDNPLAAGLPVDLRLLNEVEQATLRDRAWHEACTHDRDALVPTLGDKWEQVRALRDAAFQTLGTMLRHGWAPEEIPARLTDGLHDVYARLQAQLDGELAKARSFKGRADVERALGGLSEQEAAETATADLLRVVAQRYVDLCTAEHHVDYDQVLLQAAAAATRRADQWRDRFDTILVDESQDTNRAQFELLRALAADGYGNVAIVGDRKQCIYAFQGAHPDNARAVPGTEVPLRVNYRSVGEVLDVAHECARAVAPEDPRLEPHENRRAGSARVWFTRFADAAAEAAWIAAEIRQLEAHHVPLSAIMVLTRNRSRFPAIVDAFEQARLPIEVVDKRGAWDRPVLKTARALLRAAVNPVDDAALVRLLQEPPVALSDAELYRATSRSRNGSVLAALHGSDDDRLRTLAERVSELAQRAHTLPGAEFVSYALRRWGLLDHVLRTDTPDRAAFTTLAGLYAAAGAAFADTPAPTLAQFVETLEAGQVGSRGEQAIDQYAPRNTVRLSNAHQVKGLEFPVVFVAGLGPRRGGFPNTETLRDPFGYDDALGFIQKETWDGLPMARWKTAKGVAFDHDLRERWLARTLEEEQRLLYVAITRAKERLYLSATAPLPDPEKLSEPQYFVERLENWFGGATDAADVLEPGTHAPTPTPQEVEDIRHELPPEEEPPAALPAAELEQRIAAARERVDWKPDRAARDTVTLSFTQVWAFLQCPRLYAYRYRLRVPACDGHIADSDETPTARTDHFSPAVFGTLIHKALELYHAPDGGNLNDALAAARDTVPGPWDAYRKKAERLLAGYARWQVARADVVDRETDFVVRLPASDGGPTVRVRGAIDRIDRGEDGLVLWDYKTGKGTPETLHARYGTQLRLYTYAAQQVLRQQVESAGLLALEADTEDAGTVLVDISESALTEAIDDVRGAAKKIAAGEFAVHAAGKHADRPCTTCDYRGWCADVRTPD